MKEIVYVHGSQESPGAFKSYLEMAGYRVTLVADASQLMSILGERTPALILMDTLVKGKNGFSLCRAVRTLFNREEVPVVLCAGIYRAAAYREEARRAGANRYLLPPVSETEILREVNYLLAQPVA